MDYQTHSNAHQNGSEKTAVPPLSGSFISILPEDASLEETLLEKQLYDKLSRIDLLCSEIKQTEEDVQDFIEEYYNEVGELIDEIAQQEKLISASGMIFTKSDMSEIDISEKQKKQEITKSAPANPQISWLPSSGNTRVQINNPNYNAAEDSQTDDEIAPQSGSSNQPQNNKPYDDLATARKKCSLEKEIRKLYRSLAKDFHPDLHQCPNMAGRSGDIIRRLNEAYENRHLGSLWKIALEQVWQDVDDMSSVERLKLLRYYDKKLRADMMLVQRKYEKINKRPDVNLHKQSIYAQINGANLIEEIKSKLEGEVAQYARKINYLAATGRLAETTANA